MRYWRKHNAPFLGQGCGLLIFLFAFIITDQIKSQSDSLTIYDLDLQQLSKLKVTSASKVVQNIIEVPSSMFVITQEDLKEKGYFTLEEVLSDLPGFQFRNIQSFNSYVFQRGIPNQNNLILVLIDNVQVNELNSGGFYAGAQYNLSNVERIEIIYGPSSVAYGTNAISGVINIITKSTLEKDVGFKTLAGNFKTTANDLNYCYTNKKKTVGVLFSGMVKSSDKADLKGQAGDNNWTDLLDNYEYDYSFDLKLQAKNFILGTNYLHKQSSAATFSKSIGTVYKDYGTLWNIRFINNYLKYSKKISEKLSLSSLVYNRNATVLGNSVLYVTDTAQIGYYRPNNLTGIENILDYRMNKIASVASGLVAEYERLSDGYSITYSEGPGIRPDEPERPDMLTNYLVSMFLEPRLALFKKLYVSGGVRFDQSSIYNQVLTPRIGVSYSFYKHILRFSYAEAFRAPKPWDYTDGLGNPSLLPETMNSYEGSFAMHITDELKADFIGYANKLENAITKETVGNYYRWINSGNITTLGCEIMLRYKTRKLKSFINYTFNQSRDEQDNAIPEISKHTANAGITYSFNDYIRINLRSNFVGKRENPTLIIATNSMEVDPYIVFHGALSLTNNKGLTVQLIAKNILDKEYYHTSNRPPDRYRQPQRTILFSVAYSLDN